MAHDDFHELVGAVVAAVVLAVGGVAHVVGLAVVHRGDDVPGGSAVCDEVEGGEDSGDVKGFKVGGGEGSAEAEAFGGHAHDGQDGDRVHLHAADAVGDGVGVVAAEEVGHGEAVVEEPEVEFAGFEGSADAAVVFGGCEVLSGLGMAPGTDEIAAVSAPGGSRQGSSGALCWFPDGGSGELYTGVVGSQTRSGKALAIGGEPA